MCEVARGCTPYSFTAGGKGTVLVELDEWDIPRCTAIGDGGVTDAGHDAGRDAGRDAGNDCDDEVDESVTEADPMNCGECGHVCDEGLTCASGMCVPPVVQLAPGGAHTCALREDGRVLCWGRNLDGQLGTGNTLERLIATPALNLTGVVEIGSGKFHNCALSPDGEVLCWGDTKWGQLSTTPESDRLMPTAIAGVSGVSSLGIGFYHSCVVLENGDVTCWGWNGVGQTGRPFADTSSVQRDALLVPDVHDVLRVDGGFSFTCALVSSRRVMCWGGNEFGQLGDGTRTNRLTPAPVETPSGNPLENVIELAVGAEHGCVVQGDVDDGVGTVLCWGVNSSGAVGNGTTGAPVLSAVSTGLIDAVEIAGGVPFSCARRQNGQGLCWGANERGQLGDGTMMFRNRPTPVLGLTNATSLYVDNGDFHSCAIRDDMSVVCWGTNVNGELGNGTKTATPQLSLSRVRGI